MIKISEIYQAIQGETSRVGLPCVIVRLSGCNLDCSYCDTPHRDEINREMSPQEILDFCMNSGLNMVLITGGEPLLQKETLPLLELLGKTQMQVLLETNGSVPFPEIPGEVSIILDVKCPGSKMSDRMILKNLQKISEKDEVKFVISDRNDFDFALQIIRDYKLLEKSTVLMSPEFDGMDSSQLADWILESKLPLRLNFQIHKYIWGSRTRGR